jgi:hypothetical protein
MINYSIPIGGLNIKGRSLYASPAIGLKNTISHSTLKIGNGSIGTKITSVVTEEKKTSQLSLSFADSLMKNLTVANKLLEDEKKRSEEEKEALVKSVAETAEQVKKTFGYAEANRFMALVLTSTETGFSEDRLASAVTEFLNSVKSKALSAMSSPAANKKESGNADKLLKDLDGFVDFLNEGAVGAEDSLSLASAMNVYYGRGKAELEDKKFFTDDLRFITRRELADEEAKNKAAALAAFVITKEEVGAEVIDAAVNYLSTTVASEQAAKILEDLKEDDDIFDAVDEVRSILLREDENVAASAAPAEEKSGADVVLGAAVKGAAKSSLFNQFLESYFLQEVNKTIQKNDEVGARFTKVASQKLGVEYSFGTVGISSWPGLIGAQGVGVSFSIGFEREFSISVDKDNKIETKFTQSVKFEASFKTSSLVTVGTSGVFAAAHYLTLAKNLESRYTSARVASNNPTPANLRSSYLLSTVI